jgi:CDP-4-dehydro-6-deoxyglucose reductase, E1
MTYRVPLAYNTLGEAEVLAAEGVLRSGFMTQGREVERFEAMLAESQGSKYAILVNSGSSANLVAIEAAVYLSHLKPELTFGRISPGDEVIIQGLNWPSTIKPLLNQGLQPVFCDVNVNTLNADVATVDAVRTEKTRMVIAVPVLGNPEGLDELRTYCDSNNLILIEDACESLGAVTRAGKAVGTVGLASAFSFYFSHHISTIEGGAILTDSPELADLCYALRSHGWTRHLKLNRFLFQADTSVIDPRFCFVLPGYNVRSTELNAAIGQVQLQRLPDMLKSRRRLAAERAKAVADLDDLVKVPGSDIADRHSWMTTPLLFSSLEHRTRAQASLEAAGVETRPIIVGNMLRHPLVDMLGMKPDQPSLPACDAIFERGVMIGLNPFSDDATEAFIHAALRSAAKA